MAAAALLAELKFRDGAKEKISLNVQNNLRSLIVAVQELNTSTSRLLSELVEQEKAQGDFAQGEEDVEDSEDEEDEPEKPVNAELHPPAKRTKT
ncbi:unnamed protein product [Tetraodon nigroviridis]|nr:unnamed protein product [Tetraodon nigroviridis]